jgi:hypothetical protein
MLGEKLLTILREKIIGDLAEKKCLGCCGKICWRFSGEKLAIFAAKNVGDAASKNVGDVDDRVGLEPGSDLTTRYLAPIATIPLGQAAPEVRFKKNDRSSHRRLNTAPDIFFKQTNKNRLDASSTWLVVSFASCPV